jgi:hypothetical protein
MKQIIKKAIIKYLFSRGLSVGLRTDRTSILSLIKELSPVRTDKNLLRLGANGDGGYLVPDDLEGILACFSPGVGNLSAFENDCLKFGMKIFLADKSVDRPAVQNENFNFIKRFIGPTTDEDYITMDDWANLYLKENDTSDLLLQMDIEGYEYFSIINMSETLLKRFRIIVIEFHELEKLWDKEFFEKATIALKKIMQNHMCVHIHPNNCYELVVHYGIEIPRVAEFTFLRKDRIRSHVPQTIFPHPLDFDTTNNKTIVLPKCWFKTI